MAHKPAQKMMSKQPPKVAGLRQQLDIIKQKIKQYIKKNFPGEDTKPGQVDDDALKRMRERQKKLEEQLKETG